MMQPVTASAPGKIILFGEHAVVYGRPAIAAPVSHLRAQAVVAPGALPGVRLLAPDLDIEKHLDDFADDDAFAVAVRQVRQAAGLAALPDLTITVTSQIPIAGGLGSGAAIAAAVIRALLQFLELPHLLAPESISQLVYAVEKVHHGTPSGVDNTVVTYEQPVYFVRRQPHNLIETFHVARPLRLLIGDTGIRSSTRVAVGDVRRRWEADPATFEALFDGCGEIARGARAAIETGDAVEIGRLMRANQQLLGPMTVSSPELDRLVAAAEAAGALGAKLSGAGRGGNMIALVTPETETAVRAALLAAGARRVLATTLG
jgi:mevalonate kinase